MRRGPKIALAGAGISLVAVLVAGAVLPMALSGRASEFVTAILEEGVDADIAFEEVSVGLWTTWPNLAVTVQGLTVTGQAPFEGVELVDVPELAVEVDLWSLLGDEVVVRSVRLDEPQVHVVVTEDGRANYDITASDENAESGEYRVKLDAITVQDLQLRYEDRSADRLLTVEDLDHSAVGDVTQDAIHYVTRTTMGSVDLRDGAITMLRDTRWEVDVVADYDLGTGGVTLGESTVAINDLHLGLSGSVLPRDDGLELDLAYDTLDTSFKSLLSLVPAAYIEGWEDVETGGSLALKGTASGLYSYEEDHLPAFDLGVAVADAWVQYPDLPGKVEDIQVSLDIAHPEGAADLAEIDISPFRMAVAGQSLTVSGRIKNPVSDPWLDLEVQGALDLAELARAYPLETGSGRGRVDMDLVLSGKTSDFQAGDADAVEARGTFEAEGLTVDTLYMPDPVQVDALDVELSPLSAEVRAMDLRFGDSDLRCTGAFDGLVPYMVGQGPLGGHLQARSKVLDLVPFQGEDEEETAEDDSYIVVVPDDLDLELSGRADEVRMEGWTFRDARGLVRLTEGRVEFEDLGMAIAGGRLGVDGTYVAETTEAADVDLQIGMRDFDVSGIVETFPSVAKLIPVVRSAAGHLDASFSFDTRLRADLSPDPESLFSKGEVKALDLSVTPAIVRELVEKLGDGKAGRKLSLRDTLLRFSIADGFLTVRETPMKLGRLPGTLRGRAGVVDQSLDLDLVTRVPASILKGSELASSLGADVGDVDVTAHIGGTFDAPKLSLDLGDVARDVAEQVVDRAKEEVAERVGEAVEDLVARAEAEGDKLVAQAEKAADRLRADARKAAGALRSEASSNADRLVKEAGSNPIKKAAAREAAKRIRKEADDKASLLEDQADDKARDLVTEAKRRRSELVREARAKAR